MEEWLGLVGCGRRGFFGRRYLGLGELEKKFVGCRERRCGEEEGPAIHNLGQVEGGRWKVEGGRGFRGLTGV